MTGKQRIIKALKSKKKGRSKKELIDMTGYLNVAGRISEMKQAGIPITTTMVEGKNRYGEKTKYGVYRYVG